MKKVCILWRMKNLPKIPALFLVILLTLCSTGTAEPAKSPYRQSQQNTSISSANNPNLFAIHHQEKTGVNLLDRFPKSNSADHSQNNVSGSRPDEFSLQKQIAIYLRFCKTINRSLTVKKVIFPFHSHW